MRKNENTNIFFKPLLTDNLTRASKYLQKHLTQINSKHIAASAIVQLYFIHHLI